MSQKNIRIDDKGAKIIARAIYADIVEYIQTHQKEDQPPRPRCPPQQEQSQKLSWSRRCLQEQKELQKELQKQKEGSRSLYEEKEKISAPRFSSPFSPRPPVNVCRRGAETVLNIES